ncbi:hypothetical protein ACWEOZ_38885 [Actinoplanes sp. NPDC004185]|jgi:dehydratase
MRRKVLGGAAAAAVVTATVAATTWFSPGVAMAATTVPVSESCQVAPPLTGTPWTVSTTFVGTAPTSATKNSVFVASGGSQPWTVPSDVNGQAVTEVVDYELDLVVSSNATVLNATASGGSNLGSGTPSVTRNGNVATLRIPGPLTPGSIVELPTLNFTIRAGATAGSVTTTLGGVSYSEPGVRMVGTVLTGESPTTSPAACYPPEAVRLTQTVVR